MQSGAGGVGLQVSDVGPGIPEAELARIFKPYVSTKLDAASKDTVRRSPVDRLRAIGPASRWSFGTLCSGRTVSLEFNNLRYGFMESLQFHQKLRGDLEPGFGRLGTRVDQSRSCSSADTRYARRFPARAPIAAAAGANIGKARSNTARAGAALRPRLSAPVQQ
jgi:hypothetical protein